jgi:hypothetical protein
MWCIKTFTPHMLSQQIYATRVMYQNIDTACVVFLHIYIDWLFVLRPAQEYFTYMETSLLLMKGWKFRPMLGAQGLWAGRDRYHATPAVTLGLGFFGLIRRTAPFNRLLRHTKWCGESILSSNPNPHGSPFSHLLPHSHGCGWPILTQILSGPAHL